MRADIRRLNEKLAVIQKWYCAQIVLYHNIMLVFVLRAYIPSSTVGDG